MGEGWIIFLYNNQPKFAYTCGEDIDVGFAARNDGGQPMMTTGNDEMTDKENVQQGGVENQRQRGQWTTMMEDDR